MSQLLAKKPIPTTKIYYDLYNKYSITITFQVTENCNMACSYCYQTNKSQNKMNFDIAKDTIDKILISNLEDKYQAIIFEFIGGEPLIEVELIEQICDYTITKMLNLQHPWLPYIRFSICTNGLNYFSNPVQKFLKKFSYFTSLNFSLDGNEFLHDSCRKDLQGNKTYSKVISAIQHYRNNYEQLIHTKMTLSPENITYLYEAILNLIQNDFLKISVNCIFEKGWTNAHAKILYSELKKIGDYLLINNLYDKIYIRFFDEQHYQPLSYDDGSNWCGGVITKNNYLNFAVDYKGDMYPCIRYMNSSLNNRQEALNIGNIYNGYGKTQKEKEHIILLSNITRHTQSTKECIDCPIAAGCAWCSGYNYEEFGTPDKRATYICCMHKAASLANVYFINKLYKKLNMNDIFKMYLPEEEALKIIDKDEYNYLLKLQERNE